VVKPAAAPAAAAAAAAAWEPESAFVRAAAQAAIGSESGVMPPVVFGCGGSPCVILDQYSAPYSAVSSDSGEILVGVRH
jgi:hypothetical protein